MNLDEVEYVIRIGTNEDGDVYACHDGLHFGKESMAATVANMAYSYALGLAELSNKEPTK